MLRAIILGGSGQVGSQVVSNLLKTSPETCSKITLLSRRPLPDIEQEAAKNNDNRVTIHVVDLETFTLLQSNNNNNNDKNENENEIFKGHNAAFMLMGIGQASKASSKEELERIDADIPIAFAQKCAEHEIPHISILSSVGANPNAKYSKLTRTAAGGGWYMYCKGKMEEGIKNINIPKPFESISIIQPAAIYPGNDNTPSFFGRLNEFLNPILPGIGETSSTTQIAQTMIKSMQKQVAGESKGVSVITGGKAVKDFAKE